MNLFNTIKKDFEYWLVDQVKTDLEGQRDYAEAFAHLLKDWRKQGIGYLSLLIDEGNEGWLLKEGFRKVSAIVEYTRLLDESFVSEPGINVVPLSDNSMHDTAFADLYKRCRSGTANKNNLFSIEQAMESLGNELGLEWRTYCHIFWKDEEPIGLSIPHIEQGTTDEGRLFYFGVVPEWRGKGYGTIFHWLSFELLKKVGAATYVGSTDENNSHMIRIFETNGCRLRDKKGIYRIDKE